MKKLFVLLLTVGFCWISFDAGAMYKGTTKRFADDDEDLQLAIDVLQNTYNGGRSFAISPFAVYTTAAMLANGASKEELKEINRAIFHHTNNLDVHKINSRIAKYAENISKTFVTQNSVWANRISAPYAARVEKRLNATVHKLPKNTKVINDWVNRRTRRRVPKLIKEAETEYDDIYFINTTYFADNLEMSSKYGFPVAFDAHIEYYENKKFQAIKLTYMSGNFIQIFLPKNGDIRKFIENLTVDKLKPHYKFADLSIRIPPFKISTEIVDMKSIFASLGISMPFLDHEDDDEEESNKIRPLPELGPQKHIVNTIAFQTTFNFAEQFNPETKFPRSLISESPVGKIKFHAYTPFVFMVNNGLIIGVYNATSYDFEPYVY